MRGKDTLRTCDCAAIGITPAYAGKSLFCTCIQMCSEDHPRLCGEKVYPIRILRDYQGSPPPMRGKGLFMSYEERIEGITPAYAGKSCRRLRLCQRHQGSPPPMRGKGKPLSGAALQVRITPAYAGKSSKTGLSLLPARDHPRLCGEKKSFRGKLQSRIGSPPPMRGKVKATPPHRNEPRITPAYAGKSLR